jgi:cysteine desulfurase/selenocysteine lyase
MRDQLEKLDFVNIFYPSKENHLPIFTLIPKNVDSDITFLSQLLSDSYKIMVRGGHHCSQLIYTQKKLQGGIRASLHIYNTKEDIDKFISALKMIKHFF